MSFFGLMIACVTVRVVFGLDWSEWCDCYPHIGAVCSGIASHVWNFLLSLKMPKKFTGENTRAVAAKARKEAARKENAERKKKAEEDAYWRDDDKNVTRKQQRKEEAERKRMEVLQRKHENRVAHDEEMKTLAGKVAGPSKVTQAAIEARKRAEEERKREEEREHLLKEQRLEAKKEEIEENVNQLEVEGETARTITEAINILSVSKPFIDRHPERRLKAAYQEFEEKMLPRLREEYPTYRLSQLKQVLKKQWQKSPENPLNQKILGIIQ
uniref:Coiled-coil domain-containing protein 124 n=1 Tax=Setaria digitata TaxID=48799 RepID=A0A915PUD7_9BILA